MIRHTGGVLVLNNAIFNDNHQGVHAEVCTMNLYSGVQCVSLMR